MYNWIEEDLQKWKNVPNLRSKGAKFEKKAGIGSAVLGIKGGTYYGFQTDCPRLVPVAWLGFSIR